MEKPEWFTNYIFMNIFVISYSKLLSFFIWEILKENKDIADDHLLQCIVLLCA